LPYQSDTARQFENVVRCRAGCRRERQGPAHSAWRVATARSPNQHDSPGSRCVRLLTRADDPRTPRRAEERIGLLRLWLIQRRLSGSGGQAPPPVAAGSALQDECVAASTNSRRAAHLARRAPRRRWPRRDFVVRSALKGIFPAASA
jgi:hypothetical protein